MNNKEKIKIKYKFEEFIEFLEKINDNETLEEINKVYEKFIWRCDLK